MSKPESALTIDAIANTLRDTLGATAVSVTSCQALVGGAIQHSLAIDVQITGSEHAGQHAWVLRCDATSTISESRSRHEEYLLLQAAFDAGVRVPRPIAIGRLADRREFSLVERLPGTGLGPRVVRDDSFGGDRRELVMELGRQLALIHDIAVPTEQSKTLRLSFERQDLQCLMTQELDRLCASLDQLGARRPILERAITLARERAHAWAGQKIDAVLVHRDFRTGNLLLDQDGLQAVLDWEFAGTGDPMSDIGWFCARCWRFSRPDLEAGGLGERADFYRGYAQAGGAPVDADRIAFWEIVAHLRWATIALQQGARHGSGQEPSLALALTGRIADSLERDALAALQSRPQALPSIDRPDADDAQRPRNTLALAGSIGGETLATATAAALDELASSDTGDRRLSLRLSRNAVAILGREARSHEPRDQLLRELLNVSQCTTIEALCRELRSAPVTTPELDDALWQLATLDAWVHQGPD